MERHDLLIEFLRSILPEKPLAELYISIGYNRHGKTEFYRDLHRFIHRSRERFVIAPGKEGAVYPSHCWTSVDQATTSRLRPELSARRCRISYWRWVPSWQG